LAWRNKGLFVAATVNGQPLWRINLEQQLNSRYGEQTLDEMVGEMLIRQAAAQKKITVSKAEVDNKIAEIEKTLNGQISLQDALAQQGDTLAGFRQRVELQLVLEKLTAGQVTVSDEEVNSYIENNKAILTATDEAGMREEARQALQSQKQNTVLRQFYTDLKNKAKVSKFL
jgi:parvulin-like peptidyl-prolyl isomerase